MRSKGLRCGCHGSGAPNYNHIHPLVLVFILPSPQSLMAVTSGAEFPPEILCKIVESLHFDGDFDSVLDCWVVADRKLKQGLTACSLTCRFWAAIIRPMLFTFIVLRNAKDVEQLLRLLEQSVSVGPPITRCIASIGLEFDEVHARPWLHRVSAVFRCLNAHGRRACLDLRVNGHQDVKTRSPVAHTLPYQLFPRTVPYSIIPLRRIILTSLRLRNTSDLFRIIHGFPDLEECACRNISFIEASTTLPRPPRPGKGPTFVTFSGCGDGTLETQIALASALLPIPHALGLDRYTWNAALAAATCLVPSDYGEISISLHASSGTITCLIFQYYH